MKHQYESEILFNLMERDGFNIPSSVPPYESEIKAYLINQVKLAYPKLTDYEAEWLLYNYTKHLPADFPISSATNVTEATFENVVPFAYQSATLKGQTLVECMPTINEEGRRKTFTVNNITSRTLTLCMPSETTLKKATKYLIMISISGCNSDGLESIRLQCQANSNNIFNGVGYIYVNSNGVYKNVFTTVDGEFLGSLQIKGHSTEWESSGSTKRTLTIENVQILEYKDGMENWDIPFFTGMQSVKRPVLTTTGKNLFDGLIEHGIYSGSTGKPVDNTNFVRSVNFIKVTPNSKLCISSSTGCGITYYIYDENKNYINVNATIGSGGIVKVPSTGYYIKIRSYPREGVDTSSLETKFQIEYGTSPTPYEPYKAIILTTSEELELRGIGDVQDTLDCLTGEKVERVGEVVLDGSEGWQKLDNYTNDYRTFFAIPRKEIPTGAIIVCGDYLPATMEKDADKCGYIFISVNNLNVVEEPNMSLDTFKNKLNSKPIKFQYQLATESIKTVDLKTVNESGETLYFMPLEGTMNVQSSGEHIQPTFDMSVPVEATTQNLASFINLEMEE